MPMVPELNQGSVLLALADTLGRSDGPGGGCESGSGSKYSPFLDTMQQQTGYPPPPPPEEQIWAGWFSLAEHTLNIFTSEALMV